MFGIFGKSKKVESEDSEKEAEQMSEKSIDNKQTFFQKLKSSLLKTRENLGSQLTDLFLGKKEIDEELLQKLETHLLTADLGPELTSDVLEQLRLETSRSKLKDTQELRTNLKNILSNILSPCEETFTLVEKEGPNVILLIGINGAGKTTTAGKLAYNFLQNDLKVMLAAGDTFRAAATEQLQVWGQRNNIPVVSQHTGADSASVLYDALSSATAKNIDVLIADTAGRLHNKSHLMEELIKIKKVISKIDPKSPDEIFLVLDASIGQNAMLQAKAFHEHLGVTGLIITKLDGTSKGGIIFSIARELKLPIKFIGVGESKEDLIPFNSKEFIEALFA